MNKTNTSVIVSIIVVALVGIGIYLSYSKTDTILVPPTEPSAVSPTPTTSQAKINIDAVCNDALAYTTFPDGASAKVFVEECKEGKHPEVIERFKAGLNVGAGAAI